MSYNAFVTRIKNIRQHSNADRLQVGECFGNFVIVGLDTQENELGIYFPTDGKLGLEYCKENKLLREKDENGNQIGGYLDPDKRNVTTIKLRGEKSDGLFMPLVSLKKFCKLEDLKEGDCITILNGILICEKYIPRGKRNSQGTPNQKGKKGKTSKISYPLFEEHIDTAQLAYNLNQFKEGDLCYITLKMHGTSQRTSYTIKEKDSIFTKMASWLKIKLAKTWEYVTGTRRVVLKNFKGGFYGSDAFRKKWHDFFDGKLQKGETVYYEVVGYTDNGTTIMPECDNRKTKDVEFIKQYGNTTKFTYGCEVGQSNIFVYRMTITNEDGYVVEYPKHLVKVRCEQMGVNCCPVFESFIFTTEEDLMKRVNNLVEGADPIGKTHTREGVVVIIDNKTKFTAFKHKSFYFKVLEGIIKSNDILDIEEAENLDSEVN